jgi:Mce-associated membrane protein
VSGQAPPVRRPKVAGLHNRHGHPDELADTETTDATDATDATDTVETEDASGAGVLNGVLGAPPAEQDTAAEPAPRRTPRHAADRLRPRPAAEPEPTDADEPEAESPARRRGPARSRAVPVGEETETEPTGDDTDEPGTAIRRKAAVTRPRPTTDGDRRPAGKRRATGAARPTDLTSAETDTGAARHAVTEDRPEKSAASKYLSTAIVLAVVAVLLAGLAFFFRGRADALTSGDSNSALTDSAGTSQVVGQLSNAIKQTFSYNYTDLDATAKAVKENLTGKALCEYNLLFGEVKQYAPEQKIVLATTVREIALVRLEGDRAEALVYIDQSSTRVDVNKTVAVGGQFSVMAQRQGDHWKITEFDMFGQPLFNGKPAPKC